MVNVQFDWKTKINFLIMFDELAVSVEISSTRPSRLVVAADESSTKSTAGSTSRKPIHLMILSDLSVTAREASRLPEGSSQRDASRDALLSANEPLLKADLKSVIPSLMFTLLY